MRTCFSFALLVSCAALPDEIAVSTFTNEYDYLGGTDLKGLGSETGNSTGVMVTGTYKLKPTQMQIVQPVNVRQWSPDQLIDRAEQAADRTIEKAKQAATAIPADAVSNAAKQVTDAAAKAVDQAVQGAAQAANETADHAAKAVEKTAEKINPFTGKSAIYAAIMAVLALLLFWWPTRRKKQPAP